MCISPIFIPCCEHGLGKPSQKGKPITGMILEKDYDNQRYKIFKGTKGVYVPCGKCPECLIARQKQWYARFELESRYWSKKDRLCYFCTFTYNNENLPDSREKAVLDVQAFFKNISRKLGFKPRFYITSEFGSENNRLHFHALIFNVPRVLTRDTIDNLLRKSWHRGFISCTFASGKDFSYISKYVTKDIQGFSGDWKPIQMFSKRPSLGLPDGDNIGLRNYINSDNDCLHIRGFSYPIPRYIRNKLASDILISERLADFLIHRGIRHEISPDRVKRVWEEYNQKVESYKNKKRKRILKYEKLNCKGTTNTK